MLGDGGEIGPVFDGGGRGDCEQYDGLEPRMRANRNENGLKILQEDPTPHSNLKRMSSPAGHALNVSSSYAKRWDKLRGSIWEDSEDASNAAGIAGMPRPLVFSYMSVCSAEPAG